jgi:hypothetical protein
MRFANINLSHLFNARAQKMVNNIKSTRRLEIMARLPKSDDVWNEIFESLVLDSEPPIEYIKNVVITTKTGVRLKVSAIDFAQILERERFIHPEESDILSCRLAINFDKVRKDVNQWAEQLITQFDSDGVKPVKKRTPRKKTVPQPTDTTSKTPRKSAPKTTTKSTTKTEKETVKKPSTRKPRSSTKKP